MVSILFTLTHFCVLALLKAGFSSFIPGQVSIAKVLVGVLGATVVVVLIVVPTVIFLKGECLLLKGPAVARAADRTARVITHEKLNVTTSKGNTRFRY